MSTCSSASRCTGCCCCLVATQASSELLCRPSGHMRIDIVYNAPPLRACWIMEGWCLPRQIEPALSILTRPA